MKFNILIVAILLLNTFNSVAQEKLTIEESVIGQFGQFAPKSLSQLNWMGKSDMYAYVKDNTVYYGMTKAKSIENKLFSLEDLNKWKGGEPLKSMPRFTWTGADKCFFDDGTGYIVVDLKAKSAKKIASYPVDAVNIDHHVISHKIAFTRENNLVIMVDGVEKFITQNDKNIVSGQSISRNEYGIDNGTFWSPDASKLAFYQKDEKNVTSYPLINYKSIPASVKEIKYPMAGGKSELVSVGIYDLASAKTIFLQLDNGEPNDQFYATNLAWSPDNKIVYIAWLNRATTDMKLISFDASTGKEIKVLFKEHDDKWVEPMNPITFVPNHEDNFVWMTQRDGYTNLYLYNTNGMLLGKTTATFEITSLLGFNITGEYAYVMATGEVPTESMCYRVSLKNMSMNVVSQVHGTHNVKISGSGDYVIDQFSNLTTPNKIDILAADGRMVKNLILASNPYEGKLIGQTELFSIKAKDGEDMWCRIIKPSNFDPAKKYPVLVYVYGGPHAQMVTNSFLGGASLWMNKLAEDGYIIFTLDNHGSGNRGKNFSQIIHRKLGVQELSDQLLGVDWLKKQPFVDASRMAIHGWSYGGFMTSSMMLRYPDTFKVGVAGGPVIDWAMYEVMYGERYMDTPQENPEGYKEADVTTYVKNLKGDLLMIHGTDDNVVVMQHNMKFIKACVDNKVQVDFFAYPGHEHNVRGKDRTHLMTKVIEYIQEHL